MGPCRNCWNDTTTALQPEGLKFHVCTINKSAHTKKKSGNLFNDSRIYFKRARFKEFKINACENTTERRTHRQTEFLFIKSVFVF